MPKLRLTGRNAALVGVSAAAATAALVAVAGPALAAPSQRTTCTDNVIVRSEPKPSAPKIGECKKDEKVTVDETRDGWAHLANKKGWSSAQYVDVKKDVTSARPGTSTKPSDGSTKPSGSPDSPDGTGEQKQAPKPGPGGLLGL